MENLPFISIVIPTTGNVPFIKGLVESVSKLDYPKEKFELILIGDKETNLLKKKCRKIWKICNKYDSEIWTLCCRKKT